MLGLHEYRQRADRLADHLPWAALVAPGVVLNKDGSFQRTLAFRGPDLESATEAELVGTCARVNNVLKRLGTGWALFFDAERREALGYPDARFPDPVSWLVDQERRDRLAFVEPLTAQLGKGLGRVGFVEGDETRNPAIAEVSAIEPIQDSGSAQIGKAEHGQSA